MSSPYRAAGPLDDADEPRPQFRPKTHEVGSLIGTSALILALAWLCERLGDDAGATKLLVCWLPALVVGATVIVLERPVRAWLERRHARMVLRGVAELEAKVARADDPR